jgi:hypothetical protein
MSAPRGRIRHWAFAAGVALLVGVTFVAIPPTPPPTRVVSPDGSWAVEVFGSHFETTGFREGKFEMIAVVYDAQGRAVASRCVGTAENLASAERDFQVAFDGTEVARVGGRAIRKADFIR